MKTEYSEGGRVIFIFGLIWCICSRAQTVHQVMSLIHTIQ